MLKKRNAELFEGNKRDRQGKSPKRYKQRFEDKTISLLGEKVMHDVERPKNSFA